MPSFKQKRISQLFCLLISTSASHHFCFFLLGHHNHEPERSLKLQFYIHVHMINRWGRRFRPRATQRGVPGQNNSSTRQNCMTLLQTKVSMGEKNREKEKDTFKWLIDTGKLFHYNHFMNKIKSVLTNLLVEYHSYRHSKFCKKKSIMQG